MDAIYVPIKPKRISEEIVEQMKTAISEGKLKPGEKLPPERELAKALNVSRVSLREALNTLQSMGLLEIQQGNRSYIRPITTLSLYDPLVAFTKASTSNILQVFEIRKYLEVGSTSLAAERATPEEVAELDKLMESMREDLKKMRLGAKGDLDFHTAIIKATHNQAYIHIMKTIYDLLQEELRIAWGGVFKKKAEREKLFMQHQDILSAIKEHNPEKGAQAALAHLSFVEQKWKASLNE